MFTSPRVLFVCAGVFALAWAATLRAETTIDQIVAPGTEAEVLGTGYGFCEGPAADAQGNVYFSDGKNDSIHLYRPGKPVELFVDDSTDANGMMFNARGELVVCEGAAYRIVAFDTKTKKRHVLIEGFEGGRFNEPNDLSVDREGGIYFTDPNYRHRGQATVRKEDVYYCAPEGKCKKVSTVCLKPNGILLTADEKHLYVADNRGRVVYRFDVRQPDWLENRQLWIELGAGPDGMTLDEQGNLYVACGRAGIKVYSPEARPIGTIEVPYASNCCFGGPDFTTLYITSGSKFLGLPTKVKGLKPLPARVK
jgi:gluconolactonase